MSVVRKYLKRIKPAMHESIIKRDRPKVTDFEVPEVDKSMGERPIIDFNTMTSVYRADIVAGASVDFLWQQTAGAGFHTTMNKKEEENRVKVELVDNSTIEVNAKELIDIYNRGINAFGKLQYSARDLWATGNAFIYIPQGDIFFPRYLPLESIEMILRGEKRDWIPTGNYKVGYKLLSKYGGKLIQPSHMKHLMWNVINDEAFGTGIIQRLCLKLPLGSGDSRIEPYKIAGRLQQAMIDQFELFSGPNELWNFPGIDSKTLKKFDAKVKALPRKGKRLTSNVKDARATPVVAERSRGFDKYVDYLDTIYVIGTQTPAARFFSAAGFSEASIREIRRILQPQIVGMQKFLKYSMEELFWKPVLEGYGFDINKAQVRLIWETAKVFEPEMMLRMLPFLVRMAENRSIKVEEFRRILRDMLGLPLDKDDNVKMVTAEQKKTPSPKAPSPRSGEVELTQEQRGPQVNP